MPPPTLTLKQRLANLANAANTPSAQLSSSSPSSPLFDNTNTTRSGSSLSLPSTGTRSVSSPFSFQQQQSSRRKPLPFFNHSWSRNASHQGAIAIDGIEETRRVEEVLSKIIFQAGVDYETRPMVILNASAFPDPHDVSYDLLLTRLLSYLDLFVESDYTVVFFAAGVRHAPSWNWVWKAYRSLSRKYRKNLKKLFIVHSSFFSKMLFSLAGAIISPKFFRKITYIKDLSSLACHVPLTQIDIPPAVYQENMKHEAQIRLPTPTRSLMFGVPLEELMGYDGEKDGLPRVVRDCVQYLREAGLEEQGVFRRSPNSALLRQVREAYNRGQPVSLSAFRDPHLAAVLLKKFLRDLPDPLFPEYLYSVIQRCPSLDDSGTQDRPGVASNEGTADPELEAVRYVREVLLPELPPCSYMLLSTILNLLHEVSLRCRTNLMDARNLAIVITPSLVSSGNPLRDMQMYAVGGVPMLPPAMIANANASMSPPSPRTAAAGIPMGTSLGTVIKLCIERYYEVFDEVRDRTEAVGPAVVGLGVVLGGGQASTSTSVQQGEGDRHFRIHDSDDEGSDVSGTESLPPAVPRKKGLIERTTQHRRTGSRSLSQSVPVPVPVTTSRDVKAWNANAHQSAFAVNGQQHRRGESGNNNNNLNVPLSMSASAVSSLAARVSTSGSSSPSPTPSTGSKSRTRSLISPVSGSGSLSGSPFGTRRVAAAASVGDVNGRAASPVRKSSGSGVTAVGVTVNGFFAPPGEA